MKKVAPPRRALVFGIGYQLSAFSLFQIIMIRSELKTHQFKSDAFSFFALIFVLIFRPSPVGKEVPPRHQPR